MAKDDLTPPESTAGDLAHAGARATFSAIPIVGGAATELLALLIAPPLERRRQEWMHSVSEKLRELESRGYDLSEIAEDENFVSAVMQASSIAIRTHHAEKLEALRNAVANIATGTSLDETLQDMFLRLVDDLSVTHMRILKAVQTPDVSESLSMGALSHVIARSVPGLQGGKAVYEQLWKELHARGLVGAENINVTMSGNGLRQRQTTDLADRFLEFISDGGA